MRLPIVLGLVFNRVFFQKIFSFFLAIFVLWILRDFLLFFLVTFLFSYLFLSAGNFLSTHAQKIVHHRKTPFLRFVLHPFASVNFSVLFCYLVFLGFIIFSVSNFIPRLLQEMGELPRQFPFIKEHVDQVREKLQELSALNQDAVGTITRLASEKNFTILAGFFTNLKAFGTVILQFFVAIILSYIFIVDRYRLRDYFRRLRDTNFSFLYREYASLLHKIANAFGMIFRAQAVISFINTILTGIGTFSIGWVYSSLSGKPGFPYLFTILLAVFVLGFVPVLGFLLSSIPLLVVGFLYGGINMVLALLAMVGFIHAIEAYFLNPRIVSSYAEIPISFSFLVLFLGEHFFGPIGLVTAVPCYYLAVDFLRDFGNYFSALKAVHKHAPEMKHHE